jgi:hypothetical protein
MKAQSKEKLDSRRQTSTVASPLGTHPANDNLPTVSKKEKSNFPFFSIFDVPSRPERA